MNLSKSKINPKTIKWIEWIVAVLTVITAILYFVIESGILQTP